MSEVVAASITAGGAVLVALSGWISKRATREGRLVRRLERLGVAYAALPDSEEKKALELHLRSAGAELNRWLDVDARLVRRTQAVGVILAAFLSVGITYWITPTFNDRDVALYLASFVIGLALGGVIAALVLAMQYALSRRAERREKEAEEADAQARYSAIRRGEPAKPNAAS